MASGARGKIDPNNLLFRIDILDVIWAVAKLKGLNPSYQNGHSRAICPFHRERTPSFFIYAQMQAYHCYGCGAHGNAISFVQEYFSSEDPLIELAKLAVKRKWCTWRQIRGPSPSNVIPEYEWRAREYLVPSYYVARGCPRNVRYPPCPGEDDTHECK